MARCPYGTHRLLIEDNFTCKRCGEELRLYATLRDLPVSFYNEARRLWDTSAFDEAAMWIQAALLLRNNFAEAHWLLGAVEAKRQRPGRARYHLSRARELGANADPDWVADISAKEIVDKRPIEITKEDATGLKNGELNTPDIKPVDAVQTARAAVLFCQEVHAYFSDAIITTGDTSDGHKGIPIEVAVPDGQDIQMVANAVTHYASWIEDTYGVTIHPTVKPQE